MEPWPIGDARVARIVEAEGPTPVQFLFKHWTAEGVLTHAWLRPHFADNEGRLRAAVQALVIEADGRRIIVDTCVGNDKVRTLPAWNRLQGRFLEDLASAGYPRESIDTVVCTHLHVDHVGWNTRLVGGRWLPTFPNARYLFGRREWEFWSREPGSPDGDVLGDSVTPIVEAGLADLVEMDHRISPSVWLEPTPGHTPGHVSVHIASRGEEAVITGDLMHHPLQCAEPDLASNFDADAAAARRTRRAFLRRYADGTVRVIGTHFASPTAGRIVTHGEVWHFVP